MCGIVAIRATRGGLRADDARLALDGLHTRGPDGRGSWVSPTGRAVLGHTRLAIVDPAGGAQPIVDRSGRRVIVANGEFYGHEGLRRELTAAGVACRTGSDSEVALHLHERYGDGAVHRLHGEFAYVVWDEETGVLHAARDRFGVKPLYWAEHEGRVVVASTVAALLDCGVPAGWDPAAFADHLQLAVPADRTMIAGVRQLPPGSHMRVDDRGVHVAEYWALDFPTAEQVDPRVAGPRADHDEAFAEAFVGAVRGRLPDGLPYAVHLSGGLDSSAVLAVAAGLRSPTSFTVAFDAPEVDETATARRTAAHHGVAHHVLPFSAEGYLDDLGAVVQAAGMVVENPHAVARMRQSRAIRSAGYRVVLTGDGGDEVLVGYPQLLRDRELTVRPDRMAAARDGYRRLVGAGAPPHMASLLGTLGFLPSWVVERHLAVTTPVQELLTADFRQYLRTRDAAAPLLDRTAAVLGGRTPLHQSLTLFCRSWFPGYLLAAERLDAAEAVETRLPFLDEGVFAVARRTPPEWYADEAGGKRVLRDGRVGALLTDEVRGASKRGFLVPPLWGRGLTPSQLVERLDTAALSDNPFLDRDAVIGLVTGSGPRGAPDERLLSLAASTVLLGERIAEPAVGARG